MIAIIACTICNSPQSAAVRDAVIDHHLYIAISAIILPFIVLSLIVTVVHRGTRNNV